MLFVGLKRVHDEVDVVIRLYANGEVTSPPDNPFVPHLFKLAESSLVGYMCSQGIGQSVPRWRV